MSILSKCLYILLDKLKIHSDMNKIAMRCGTDKLEHGYIKHYMHHLESLRYENMNILEIGIGQGASLCMWKKYFPNSVIHAIDKWDKSKYISKRLKIYQGDQNDEDFLKRFAQNIPGGFEIIIDDGSHISEHVITSFKTLFPFLKTNGIYIIEDLHTSYWSDYGGEWNDLNTGKTSMSYIKNLLDGLNCHWIPGHKSKDFDLQISAIHCYPKIVFIYKGENPVDHRPHELQMMQNSLEK